jgi:hypothetical protein
MGEISNVRPDGLRGKGAGQIPLNIGGSKALERDAGSRLDTAVSKVVDEKGEEIETFAFDLPKSPKAARAELGETGVYLPLNPKP